MTDEKQTEITLVDTLFKTEKLTMMPDQIKGIEVNGNSYKVHMLYDAKPIVAVLGAEEDLEVLTDRWGEAIYNSTLYNNARLEAEQAIYNKHSVPVENTDD